MFRNLLLDKNNKETLLFGNLGFPLFVGENRLERFALGYVPWHWHHEMQFSVVTEGSVLFQTQGEQYILSSGEGIFINSGFLHMAKPKSPDATYICIDADTRLISSFPGSVIEEKYLRPFLGTERMAVIPLYPEEDWSLSILNDLIDVYNTYRDKEFGYELKISANLMIIWEGLLKSGIQSNGLQKYLDINQRIMKDIITYIEDHYDEKITLDDISKSIHLSRGECCRSFKRNSGITIFEYLIGYRIQKSAELLAGSTMTISQIASTVGFSNASYFTEIFKKHTNQTPSEYRLSNSKLNDALA